MSDDLISGSLARSEGPTSSLRISWMYAQTQIAFGSHSKNIFSGSHSISDMSASSPARLGSKECGASFRCGLHSHLM